MQDFLLPMREMIKTNPFAIVKSPLSPKKVMLETLEADQDGVLWCWIDEQEIENVRVPGNLPEYMKFADKPGGRYIIVHGNATVENFFSNSMAHLFNKNRSGYLLKIVVREMEYFEKKKVARNINLIESVRKYSQSLMQRIGEVRMIRKQAI